MNKNIKKTVYKILKEDEYARDNLGWLTLSVVQELRPELVGQTFAEAILKLKDCEKKKQISFESVYRARRDLVRKYPKLRGKKEIEKARREEEENYIVEYSRR